MRTGTCLEQVQLGTRLSLVEGLEAFVCDDPNFQGCKNPSSGDMVHATPNIGHSQDFIYRDIRKWSNWLRSNFGIDRWCIDFVKGLSDAHCQWIIDMVSTMGFIWVRFLDPIGCCSIWVCYIISRSAPKTHFLDPKYLKYRRVCHCLLQNLLPKYWKKYISLSNWSFFEVGDVGVMKLHKREEMEAEN